MPESDRARIHRVAPQAIGAVEGPILFTVAWFVLGFLSPGFTIFDTTIAPYSPISAGISGLGSALPPPS